MMIKERVLKVFSGLITLVFGRDITYRRVIGGSVWHSSERCKYWPTENFEEMIHALNSGFALNVHESTTEVLALALTGCGAS